MRRALRFLRSDLGRIAASAVLFLPALIGEHAGMPFAAYFTLYLLALAVAGGQVLVDAIRGILRRDLLDEKFLMTVAAIGAMAIGKYSESVAVMLFFLVGEYFEHRAVARSRQSIQSLMSICPDEATLLDGDGTEQRVEADEVAVGSRILVRTGERVPIDCRVLTGSGDVDTSALTGESVPRGVTVGDELASGAVLISGVLVCQTLREAGESAAARILTLVEDAADGKSREESFITAFAHYYTPIVVTLAVLLAVGLPFLGLGITFRESLERAFVFLVVSCPCALVISVPMAFFGGIGGAASHGILFKGGNVFAPVAKARTFAFDKTGTLTTGHFQVAGTEAVGLSCEELIRIAAAAEYGSNHPIALCIRQAAPDAAPGVDAREIPGRGSVATVDGHRVAVGSVALMQEEGIAVQPHYPTDGTCVFVGRDGQLLGRIGISDAIKPEAAEAIASLHALGVERTVMLSGDKREKAEAVGQQVGIRDIRAELLPDEKYAALQTLIQQQTTAYVGDGINDAPSLAWADVGFAMGAIGADSAIEAADVVIISDDLKKLPLAVRIARRTLRIAKENIAFALTVKGVVLILGALGYAPMWLAIFADVGVAMLAILNAMRTLSAGRQQG